MLCRNHGCELEIPFYPAYRFFHRDYSVFDRGGMAFSEAKVKPVVRICSGKDLGQIETLSELAWG
jgi:hypothetical protein